MTAPELYIAADGLSVDPEHTLRTLRRLHDTDLPFGIKVNLDAVVYPGLQRGLESLPGDDRPIFVDLKMWNGARTMEEVLIRLECWRRVSWVTVHALGDTELAKALAKFREQPRRLRVAATTVLTHYDDAYCRMYFGRTRAVTVREWTKSALHNGCDAVVLPGSELEALDGMQEWSQTAFGRGFQTIVPGIREAGAAPDGRHVTEVTPAQARAAGASIVVCGSPIMKVPDPEAALRRILAELQRNPEPEESP